MASSEDPLLSSARRETIITFIIWAAAMIYTVGVCGTMGYNRDVTTLKYVLGFPDWIFWGIIIPWAVCTVISAIFAMAIMQDSPLSDDEESTG